MYWIGGGMVGMFLVSLLNYQALLDKIHWLYIASLASLMMVLVFGQKYLGARRWIKMPGGAHFQPSEWVKLILIIAVAKYFTDLSQRELHLAGLSQGRGNRGYPHVDGAGTARPGNGAHLPANRNHGPVFRRIAAAKQALIVILLAG